MDSESVPEVDPVPHGGADEERLLDFSANVNPDRPPGVAGVYGSALAAAGSYPGREYEQFADAAGASVDCDPDRVVATPGGLAAIRLAVSTAVDPGDTAVVPAPSFSEYAREVRLQGGDPAFVDHDAVLEVDPASHALAVVCNPNNPTGGAYPVDELRAFARRCREAGTPLLVDEAFLDYAGQPSLAGTPGTVVARSLTKVFGLPGLRAGFAVATGDRHSRLERAGRPWAVSTPAALVGAHCLRQRGFVRRTRERTRRERRRLRERLSGTYDVAASDAPFLLLDVGDEVASVLRRAREHGIAVRDATTFRGLDSHVRVAVKRPGQNDRLIEALLDG